MTRRLPEHLKERRASTTRYIQPELTDVEDALRWVLAAEANGLGTPASSPEAIAVRVRSLMTMAESLVTMVVSSPQLSHEEPFLIAQFFYQKVVQALIVGRSCVYCGEEATTFDHVIPRAHGGLDHHLNLVPVCHTCNTAKGALDAAEFYEYAEHRFEAASGAIVKAQADADRWTSIMRRMRGERST